MKILVTDGNSRAALAVTRSLGARGHDVYVACESPRSLAACSKYCCQDACYADPTVNSAAFLDDLVSLVERFEIDVLLPVTDICVLPVAENRDRFETLCHVPLPSWESLRQAADKISIVDIARKLDVAVPTSVVLQSAEQISVDREAIPFPLVIKPSRSRVRQGDSWLYTSVDYAYSEDDLKQRLAEIPPAAYPVLLQERVKGPGIGVFYCFDNGKRVATFAHKRLHEKPPSGGVSVLRESVSPHPKADEYGQALLEALSWHGVAMVEFKLDDRDDTPKLMEINGRLWGSLQLAIDSGVDFPDILVRLAVGEHVQPVDNYELGVRSRWLCGELDLLLLFLLKSRATLNLPDGHPSRFTSALKVVNPFIRKQKLEVLRFSDIKPWIHEMRQWLRH